MKLKIFSREVLKIRTEYLELILVEDMNGNLSIRFPPPIFSELQEQLTQTFIWNHVNDIHRKQLVVRVLNNAKVAFT